MCEEEDNEEAKSIGGESLYSLISNVHNEKDLDLMQQHLDNLKDLRKNQKSLSVGDIEDGELDNVTISED